MQAVILHSTYSGSGNGVKVAKKIQEKLSDHKLSFDHFENKWPHKLNDYNCAILVGGDGTINYFFNKYMDQSIPIILFPAGTGNDFYWSQYGKKSLNQQMDETILYLQGKIAHQIRQVDIGKCIIDSHKTKYFNNSIGLGFDGAVLQNMNAIRWIGGHLGYMVAVVRNIFTFKEPTYEVSHSGSKEVISATILNIANASRTGGGFMISPQALTDDGLLNVLYCAVPGILPRLMVLTKVEKGKHLTQKNLYYFPTNHIKIHAFVQTKGQADGELIGGQDFDISLADWKAKIIVF